MDLLLFFSLLEYLLLFKVTDLRFLLIFKVKENKLYRDTVMTAAMSKTLHQQ